MNRNNSLAAALWLLAAVAAFAAGPTWAGSLQDGMMSPWALVAFFWGAAALSVLIHYLARYLAKAPHALNRWWSGHRAAAALSVAIHYLSHGAEALRRYLHSLATAERRGAWLRGRVWRLRLAVATRRLASGLAPVRHH